MKINLNDEDIKKLNQLLDKRDLNLYASDLYNSILTNYFDSIKSDDFISNDKEKEFFTVLMNNIDLAINQDDMKDLINHNRINIIKKLELDEYTSNPYYQLLNKLNLNYKQFKLKTNNFEPYELFLYDEPSENDFYEINNVGYFDKDFPYLTIQENNQIWMSVTPYEINSMKKSIAKAKNNVLTFGLGLGYFPYMCLNKEEVSSVTIIEKSKEVIDLFKDNLLPLFDKKNKIKIINDDCFNYIKTNNLNYDYIFVDIHHNETDGLKYLLKIKETKKKISHLDFWIKKSILLQARRYLLTLIEENYQGFNKNNYNDIKTDEDYILNKLFALYENISINSYKELEDMLSLSKIESILFS